MIVLLKSLATPIMWVLILMVLCLILIMRPTKKKKRFKFGKYALFLAIFILFLLSIEPVSNLLIYYLECRYDVPSEEILADADMMVILGGGMNIAGGLRENAEARGLTYARMFNGVRIYKRSGATKLALCGGSAEVMKELAVELGVEESRIITETGSQTTMENASELAKLLPPAEQRRIGLVTSALHMFRSEKAFKKQFPNDVIVPVPVNYIYCPEWYYPRHWIPSAKTFLHSNYAIHEWIGIVYYSIRY